MAFEITINNILKRLLQFGVVYSLCIFGLINIYGSTLDLKFFHGIVLPAIIMVLILVAATLLIAKSIKQTERGNSDHRVPKKRESIFISYSALAVGGISFWLWMYWFGPYNHLSGDEPFLAGCWLAITVSLIFRLVFMQGSSNAHR
jgi:hypothetical protein